MYKIIGGDGNEYGPVSVEQLLQWITEGRANNQTRVQREGETEWKPLAACPEFAEALTAQVRAQLGTAAATPPPFSSGTAAGGQSPLAEGDYQIDIGGCIGRSWELTKSNLGVLLAGLVVYVLIAFAFGALGAVPFIGPLFSLINFVIGGPLLGGLYFLFLRVVRGEAAGVGDLFAGFRRRFGNLFLGHVVSSLLAACCLIPAALVGMMSVIPALIHHQQPSEHDILIVIAVAAVGVIPMIYLQISWMFTLPLIIDREMDFWPAMKLSWRRVNLHWWLVFLLVVLTGLLNIAGALLCCVGLIFTVPLCFAAIMVAYETIFSGTTARGN